MNYNADLFYLDLVSKAVNGYDENAVPQEVKTWGSVTQEDIANARAFHVLSDFRISGIRILRAALPVLQNPKKHRIEQLIPFLGSLPLAFYEAVYRGEDAYHLPEQFVVPQVLTHGKVTPGTTSAQLELLLARMENEQLTNALQPAAAWAVPALKGELSLQERCTRTREALEVLGLITVEDLCTTRVTLFDRLNCTIDSFVLPV